MAFQCVLVTPEKQLLDESITQAIVPAHDGLVGILPHRAPLLVKLGTGPLRIDLPDTSRRYFFVDGGIAQMRSGRLTILTTEAIPAEEVDAEAARAEYAQATASKAIDDKAFEQRQHRLERSRAMQNLARA